MMKTIFQYGFLMMLITSCTAQLNEDITHMTPELWAEDVTYLNRRIQKEFASFDPGIKAVFESNAISLKAELNNLSNPETAIKIGQLIASLKDGHTELNVLQSTANLDRLPLSLYYFKEGLYIMATHEPYSELIGKRLKKIGSLDVEDFVTRLKKIMTYDNDYEIYHAGPQFLVLPDVLRFIGAVETTSEVPIIVENNGGQEMKKIIKKVNLSAFAKGPWKSYSKMHNINPFLYQLHSDLNYWYDYLKDEETLYFYIGRTNDQKGQSSLKKTINALFKDIDKIRPKKLVIDIRTNSGGNYNKARPLIEGLKDRPWLNQKGKIFVLNGRKTFSAAMVTSIFLKRETEAILVGEPSRGHPNKCDNNEYMTLPNSGLSVEYTTKVEKHWPELGEASFVPIDVAISPSFSNYSLEIDGALQYVLDQ